MTKSITQILPNALTETPGHLTKESPLSTEALEKWCRLFEFQTLNDPQLEAMLEASAKFYMAIKANENPRWLTLLGSSGAGKTYLARKVYRRVREMKLFQTSEQGAELSYPDDWIYWPSSAAALQKQEHPEDVYHAPRTKFLVLDEVGGIKDSTGYVTNLLALILGQREKRWTVITSNLTSDQISERLDTRIASRLIRGKNVVVEVDVQDFSLRGAR